MIVSINLGVHSYDVVIEQGVLARADKELNLNRKVLVVTDKGVPAEYAKSVADKCKFAVIGTIEGGEDHKNLDTVQNMLQLMLDNSFTRGDCVVAVGGGVVGDLAKATAAVSHDKKAGAGAIHAIVVNEIGTFEQKDMTLDELSERLKMVVEA